MKYESWTETYPTASLSALFKASETKEFINSTTAEEKFDSDGSKSSPSDNVVPSKFSLITSASFSSNCVLLIIVLETGLYKRNTIKSDKINTNTLKITATNPLLYPHYVDEIIIEIITKSTNMPPKATQFITPIFFLL